MASHSWQHFDHWVGPAANVDPSSIVGRVDRGKEGPRSRNIDTHVPISRQPVPPRCAPADEPAYLFRVQADLRRCRQDVLRYLCWVPTHTVYIDKAGRSRLKHRLQLDEHGQPAKPNFHKAELELHHQLALYKDLDVQDAIDAWQRFRPQEAVAPEIRSLGFVSLVPRLARMVEHVTERRELDAQVRFASITPA